jgi:hypothetical protein
VLDSSGHRTRGYLPIRACEVEHFLGVVGRSRHAQARAVTAQYQAGARGLAKAHSLQLARWAAVSI